VPEAFFFLPTCRPSASSATASTANRFIIAACDHEGV
jgi:hypothetical protein